MNTSDVLNKAADLIEERGWAHGTGWHEIETGPLCAEGAIAAAMGKESGVGNVCPAYNAVREYVGDFPFTWNDRLIFDHDSEGHIRGFVGGSMAAGEQYAAGQVIATLRAAALIEAAKENADTRAQVTA